MLVGNISLIFSNQKSKGYRPTKRQGMDMDTMDIVGNWQNHTIKEFKILTTILSLIYIILPKSLFPKAFALWAFACISISQLINEHLMKLGPNMKTGFWAYFHAKKSSTPRYHWKPQSICILNILQHQFCRDTESKGSFHPFLKKPYS